VTSFRSIDRLERREAELRALRQVLQLDSDDPRVLSELVSVETALVDVERKLRRERDRLVSPSVWRGRP
jgi:hypothetical protein